MTAKLKFKKRSVVSNQAKSKTNGISVAFRFAILTIILMLQMRIGACKEES